MNSQRRLPMARTPAGATATHPDPAGGKATV